MIHAKKYFYGVLALTLLGGLIHFYNLTWGSPFFFHPDERNIASSISQLHFPDQMNPHFFAYGSLPLYTIYITGLLSHFFSTFQLRFEEAILISRLYSALFATLLIPLLFLLGKKLKDEKTGLIAAIFATVSVGFIQFSHFGTFEMWLTFFSLLLFWFCLKTLQQKSLQNIFFLALLSGILIATKISHLVILPLPLLAILFHHIQTKKRTRIVILRTSEGVKTKKIARDVSKAGFFAFVSALFFFAFIVFFVYIITNPYVFLDPASFLSSMKYESSVGFNTLPVFYTGGFYDTIPMVYQFLHVYPFLLNPLMTVLFIGSFLSILYKTIATKHTDYLFLIFFYLFLFLSQAFLFIKWTRYMVPTLPFIYLIIAISLSYSLKKRIRDITIIFSIIICIVFAGSYFITAFVQPDTRITAATIAKKIIPNNARILSETYDLGITAFTNPSITLFNTYDLDTNSLDYNLQLWNHSLNASDYLILPSQRVLQPRLQNPKQFPQGHTAYQSLLNGTAGYKKIYETPCDIFCKITYLGDPVFHYEQTANVFDRPTVFIFKNTK